MADETPNEHFHGQPEKTPEFEIATPPIALETMAELRAITSERPSFRAHLSSVIADGNGAAQNRAAYLLRNPR